MTAIEQILDRLAVKKPGCYTALSVFPLLSAAHDTPCYATLVDALQQGWVQVTEVSAAGSVPELQLDNKGDKPILLVDGEELSGGKQNRIINLTLLVPAHASITIPVSCVESGRWHRESTHFKETGRAYYARGRAAKAASVSASMQHHGSRHSDQGEIWDDISDKMERMRSTSGTGAMAAVYEQYEDNLRWYIQAFDVQEQQVGAVFALSGDIAGLEVFDSAVTFAQFFPKLIRSYALDAIESNADTVVPPAEKDAVRFLTQVGRAKAARYPALGLGTDIRFSSRTLVGGALEHEQSIVHLVAFARQRASASGDPASRGMASARVRRRYRNLH